MKYSNLRKCSNKQKGKKCPNIGTMNWLERVGSYTFGSNYLLSISHFNFMKIKKKNEQKNLGYLDHLEGRSTESAYYRQTPSNHFLEH